MKQEKTKYNLPLISADLYQLDPERYILKKGSEEDAPPCPYGNAYQWIGYDLKEDKYIRFTKSVFKKLVKHYDPSD